MKIRTAILLAVSAPGAIALPVRSNSLLQQDDTIGTTQFYSATDPLAAGTTTRVPITNRDKITSYFPEWLADFYASQHQSTHSDVQDSRRAGGDDDWFMRARKMLKTWSVFYKIEYPARRHAPLWQSFDGDNNDAVIRYRAHEDDQDDHSIRQLGRACGIIAENLSDGDTVITKLACSAPLPPSSSSSFPSSFAAAPHRDNSRLCGPGYLNQLRRDLGTMDVAMICSRYGPEIVALCIFMLVPLAVALVEIVDVVQSSFVTEQFPERGRGRVRLTGPERRLSVLAKCEREKMIRDQAQRSWANSRKGSRHSLD